MNSIKILDRPTTRYMSMNPSFLVQIWADIWVKNVRYHKTDTRLKKTVDKINHLSAAGINFLNQKVLDVGCGEGATLRYLQNTYKTTGYGIDLSIEAISKAKTLSHANEISFSVNDTRDLPYQNSFFDTVLSWGVIEHFTEDMLAISEYRRVLKPSGTLILIQPNILSSAVIQERYLRMIRRWSFGMHKKHLPLTWKKELERCGFRQINMFSKPPYEDMKICRKIDTLIQKIIPQWGHYLYIIAKR